MPSAPGPATNLARMQASVSRVAVFILGAWAVALPAARAQAVDPTDQDGSLAKLTQLSIEDLMNTEVTSVSGYAQPLQQAASSIDVISNEDIRRSGAEVLPDALRLADNLDVAQKDPHDWAISARGFNANLGDKMLVLIDGRSVYSPLFSGVFWNAQDYLLEDVQQVEVISGPGGTLWGANAVNGVINVTTKGAQDTQGLYFEGGGGAFLEEFAGLRYGGTLAPNVYYRVYAKELSYGDGVLSDGQRAADGWNQGQGGFRIDAFPSPDTTLNLQGDLYGSNLDIQSGNNAHMGGGNLMGHWSRSLSGDAKASVQVYYSRDDLTDPINATVFAPAGPLRSVTDTYDAQFQNDFILADRNHLVWGLEYRFVRNDILQEGPSLAFLPPVQGLNLYSGFVQDDYDLLGPVHLIAGTKIEHNDYTHWEWEPNVRLRWDLSPRQTAWVGISRSVRTPSRLDRDLFEPNPPPVFLGGGPDFTSETMLADEVGYRGQLSARASVSASVFYDAYDHVRSLGETPGTILPFVYQNGLRAWTAGAEVSADYKAASWWRLHAGYDLLREHVWVMPGQIDVQNALAETADPENQVFLRSSMDLADHLSLDLAWRWIDSLIIDDNNQPGVVPAYDELDARLGWQVAPGWELSLVGENLLHAYHAEYGPPGPLNEEIPRTVYGKVAWHF